MITIQRFLLLFHAFDRFVDRVYKLHSLTYPRWAQETQNVAAKSVFKMAGGYFPRGGGGQITSLLC